LWNIHIPTALSKIENFIIKKIDKTHFKFMEGIVFMKAAIPGLLKNSI